MNILEILWNDLKETYENSSTPGQGKSMSQYGYNSRHNKQSKKEDTVDTSSKKSKTASTGKGSDTTSSKAATISNPQSSTSFNTPTGNMDWMSEYGSPQTTTGTTQQEEREPFNAIDKVWNDEVLSKVDTAVASRYLKNNLQDLLNLYNMKVAETIGQKRG